MTLTDIRHEEPLFVETDGGRKFIGKRITLNDGQRVWLRELKQEHVMRKGQLGFDAITYDTHFAGRPGYVLVRLPGDVEYQASHETIDAFSTRRSYGGHGLQVFLAFRYWHRPGEASMVEAGEAESPATSTCPACRTPSHPERCPEKCWCQCHAAAAASAVEWPCPKCGRPLEAIETSIFDPNFGTGICGRSVSRCTRKRQTVRRNPTFDAAAR